MAETEQMIVEQKRQKRQRVSNMKKMIVVFLSSYVVITFVLIVVLAILVGCLFGRIHKLEKIINAFEVQGIETSEEIASAQSTEVVRGIDFPQNFAKEGDAHYVYFTFDSNPGPNTESILDVLAAYQVKATFFVTGDESEEAEQIYKRIVEEGHSLGMRSYANQMSVIYSSVDAFTEDYEQISSHLKRATGLDCKLYRFLGGSGNGISNLDMAEFVRVLNENDTVYYDWNVSAGDAAADYSAKDVVDNVLEGISQYKTSVVLLHDDDTKSTTVDALGPLIEELQQTGAHILPIDDTTTHIQYIHADSVE